MNRQEYFNHPATSCGTITKLMGSVPRQVRYDLDNPKPPTEAMDLGTIAHRAVLEGISPENGYFVVPDDFSFAHHKKFASVIDKLKESGKPPLKKKSADTVRAMYDAIMTHPFAVKCFQSGFSEHPHFWTCPSTGLDCKALYDHAPDGIIYSDYKTTESVDTDSLKRQAANLHWAHRAFWYLDGVRDKTGSKCGRYGYVCQSRKPPYLVRVIFINSKMVKNAGYEVLEKRTEWLQCLQSGVYPSWGEVEGCSQVELFDLPPWEAKRLEYTAEELAGYHQLFGPLGEIG